MTSVTLRIGTEDTIEASIDSIAAAINESVDLTADLEASLPLDWSAIEGKEYGDWFEETAPSKGGVSWL